MNLLIVTETKTYSQETLSITGIPQVVYVVIKNSPFFLTVCQFSEPKYDLNKVTFKSTLVYNDENLTAVDFLKSKPVETKVEPNETGEEMKIECRIKVLSSQHKDMFFRVRVDGFIPDSDQAIAGLSVVSGAIKVISKPEGKSRKGESKGVENKNKNSDPLLEIVSRLETQQKNQEELLVRLLQSQENAQKYLTEKKIKIEENEENEEIEEIEEEEERGGGGGEVDFEESFRILLNSYNAMSAEERPEVIRKLLGNSSLPQAERLSELLDLFWSQGLEKPISLNQVETSHQDCDCINCPHKAELQRLDDSLKDFLFNPFQ